MDAVQHFTLSIAQEVDRIVVYIHGELDFTMSSCLMNEVEMTLPSDVRTYVFDLENVTFIDSEIVKSLLNIHHRLLKRNKKLYLRNCNSQVRRIISILGLQCLLDNGCKAH